MGAAAEPPSLLVLQFDHERLTVKLHLVAGPKAPLTARLHRAVNENLAALNQQLRVAARLRHPEELEYVIEADGGRFTPSGLLVVHGSSAGAAG